MGMKSKLYQSLIPGVSFTGFVLSSLSFNLDPTNSRTMQQALAAKYSGETLYF